jgi:hypothetical protein
MLTAARHALAGMEGNWAESMGIQDTWTPGSFILTLTLAIQVRQRREN